MAHQFPTVVGQDVSEDFFANGGFATIEYSLDGGKTWKDHTTTSMTGRDAWDRLRYRVKQGEINPVEDGSDPTQNWGMSWKWRLRPCTLGPNKSA